METSGQLEFTDLNTGEGGDVERKRERGRVGETTKCVERTGNE